MIASFAYNFRDYGIKSLDNKASLLAKTVEHTLTSEMQLGVIDRRDLFLRQLENLPNINKVWISRSNKITELYGKADNNEMPRDDIDLKVLATGKEIKVIDEKLFGKSEYRITIPYKARIDSNINCISCHTNSKVGDTLGAITITIPIDDAKEIGINTIFHTTAITFILILVIGLLINNLISPFLKLFDSIRKVMNKANKGDYSYRIDNIDNTDAKNVSIWINSLLDKLESTLRSIDSNISIFLSNKHITQKDPLLKVEKIVDNLSDIYKFRKTIEQDESIEQIYKRIAFIVKNKLNIKHFSFFEANTISGKIENVYSNTEILCDIIQKGCRADRTNSVVDSTQFGDVCNTSCDKNYFCIPYTMSNELDFIISIYTENKNEENKIKESIPFIDDYIDAAKSVIISMKLLHILEKSAITDALTKLYNRKYLEQIPKLTSQAKRTGITYGILMLDIDHFKEVNDNYGHDVGDNAIKVVADTLIENIRISDVAIRYGGEEFIILLHNCNEEKLYEIADKIRESFKAKAIKTDDSVIKKTISIGGSMYPKDSSDLNICIKYADVALYEAKNTGRDKVIVFDETLLK